MTILCPSSRMAAANIRWDTGDVAFATRLDGPAVLWHPVRSDSDDQHLPKEMGVPTGAHAGRVGYLEGEVSLESIAMIAANRALRAAFHSAPALLSFARK